MPPPGPPEGRSRRGAGRSGPSKAFHVFRPLISALPRPCSSCRQSGIFTHVPLPAAPLSSHRTREPWGPPASSVRTSCPSGRVSVPLATRSRPPPVSVVSTPVPVWQRGAAWPCAHGQPPSQPLGQPSVDRAPGSGCTIPPPSTLTHQSYQPGAPTLRWPSA